MPTRKYFHILSNGVVASMQIFGGSGDNDYNIFLAEFSVFLLFKNKIEYLWHGIKSLKNVFPFGCFNFNKANGYGYLPNYRGFCD